MKYWLLLFLSIDEVSCFLNRRSLILRLGQVKSDSFLQVCSTNVSNITIELSYTNHSAWNSISNCSLAQCLQTNNNSNCLPLSMICFDYRTRDNINYCAPAGLCSLLEPCDMNEQCPSIAYVCVVNTCCTIAALCLPREWIDFCSSLDKIEKSFWSFDTYFLDIYSNLDGQGVYAPAFFSPEITGYGLALFLNASLNQYVTIPTFRNLTYSSFTVEMWIYSTDLTQHEYGLFSQQDSRAMYRSLHYIVRNRSLHMSFFTDDTSGSTELVTDTWYHVAFVYDYPRREQRIYLNGIVDGVSSSKGPYQGMSGSINIGMTNHQGFIQSFNGLIDQVLLIMRVKNANEILNDATLVTYHSFDGNYLDSGPNGINGTATDVSFVSGHINQALNFTSNFSQYQMTGFVLLGTNNHPYSFALWVKPRSINGGMLVNLYSQQNSLCIDMLGLSSSGQIIATIWNGTIQQIIGSILPANIWTHIVSTYSATNGLRLFVNGTFVGTTGSLSCIAPSWHNSLTLGGGNCSSINSTNFSGYIDEFRIYSRELNASTIAHLANQ